MGPDPRAKGMRLFLIISTSPLNTASSHRRESIGNPSPVYPRPILGNVLQVPFCPPQLPTICSTDELDDASQHYFPAFGGPGGSFDTVKSWPFFKYILCCSSRLNGREPSRPNTLT